MIDAFMNKVGEIDDKITARGVGRSAALYLSCGIGGMAVAHFGVDVPSACSAFAQVAGKVVLAEMALTCLGAAGLSTTGKDADPNFHDAYNDVNDAVKGFAQGTILSGSLVKGAYVLSKVL